MAYTTGNDVNFLQSTDTGIVDSGAGNDRYILSSAMLSANQVITISDAQGVNTLQLVDLTITSSKVLSNAVQLTLSNGAVVNVNGADTFSYVVGGSVTQALSATNGTTQTFSQFATATLSVAAVPAAGAALVSGGAVNNITSAGVGTTTQSFTLTTSAVAGVATAEGNTVTITVTPTAAVAAATTLNLSVTGQALGAYVAGQAADFGTMPSVSFAAGATAAQNVTFTVATDTTVEGIEAYKVALLNSLGVEVANTLTGIINDASSSTTGTPIMLTAGADTKTGTGGDDIFDGTTSNYFSAFDSLDGGLGNDTLNAVISGTALPSGVVVKGIETASVNSTGAGLTADVSGWTGLTTFNTTSSAAGAEVITAAATTDATVSFISAAGVSNTFNGGKNLILTGTMAGTADTITVGGTTAPVGNVTINAAIANGLTIGAITVTTKGTTVSSTVTGTGTHAAMNVTDGGVSSTLPGTLTTVTLDGVLATAGSTITANSLSHLTLANGTGTGNLTITNTLASAIAAKTSVLNLTLNNHTGATTLVDTNAEIGTLNITTAGGTLKDSALAAITDANLTALNIAGTNKLTLAAATGLAGLKTIAVSGAAGFTAAVDVSAVATGLTSVNTTGTTGVVTLGSTTVTQGIATTTNYAGGAGNDVLTVGATTKAIDLGAGDNTLYLLSGTTALGTGGTVAAGSGTADTLGMVVADAVTASASSTFASKVTGFERLTLGAASANPQTVDVAALLGATNKSYVTTTGVATNILRLSNLDATGTGATLIINHATGTTNAGVTLNGSTGSSNSDVVNLTLKDTATGTTGAAVVPFGTIDAANVETFKITVNDARTTSVGYQSLNTVTLTDPALTSLVISGNQSLALTHTAGTALTSVDASGLTVGKLSFTSNASQYATTVKGSTLGGDYLNFSATLAPVTLTETAGANTVLGGIGADTIVGGTGADLIYADNGGTNRVETYTITTAGAGTATLNILGVATTVTYATSGDNTIGLLDTALKNDVRYGIEFTSSITANAGTTTDDVLNVTYLVDGNNVGTATTSAGTLAINTTGTNATLVNAAQTTLGVAGATAKNVLTGGTGTDTFVFGATSVAPSDSVFNTITDFATASDIIDYAPKAITIVNAATAAVSGTATISTAGIATFAAADNTLALRIIATEAGIQAGTATAGQSAVFQFGADAYAFISNGVDGVGAGDQLIKLTGVDTTTAPFDTLTLANGNATLA